MGDTDVSTTAMQLDYILQLPNDLKKYFPEIIDYNISSKKVVFKMPYYNLKSLHHALSDINEPSEIIMCVIDKLFDVLFNYMYRTETLLTIPPDYIKETYIDKFFARYDYMNNKIEDINSLMQSDKIIINDRLYYSAPIIMKKFIDANILDNLLKPQTLVKIHGDLELEHILFSMEDKETYKLILLDPRVYKYGGDYLIDVAKLLQSIHGYMNDLIDGRFELLRKATNEFSLNIKHNRNINEIYLLQEHIYTYLEKRSQINHDKNWNSRCLFIEALNMLNAPPFYMSHVNNKGNLPLALYLRGTQILNELYDKVII